MHGILHAFLAKIVDKLLSSPTDIEKTRYEAMDTRSMDKSIWTSRVMLFLMNHLHQIKIKKKTGGKLKHGKCRRDFLKLARHLPPLHQFHIWQTHEFGLPEKRCGTKRALDDLINVLIPPIPLACIYILHPCDPTNSAPARYSNIKR